MIPQDEAIQILQEIIRDLTLPEHDLKAVLRRCQHACQLLAWKDQRDWFQRAIGGYPAGTEVPAYRKITGRVIWRPRDLVRGAIASAAYGPEPYEAEREDTVLEVRSVIDWLLAASQSGYNEPTGETRRDWSGGRNRWIQLERVRIFDAGHFAFALRDIEQMTFAFASRSYTFLRYGNVLTDFWTEYRTQVDATLQRLNLTAHLDAIQSGLQSDNPESWRAAVLGCRNLLNDVANYLWRDKRKAYEHLAGDRGGKLDVVQGKFANRLGAYLHQKGLRGTRGKFLRDDVERLAISIRSLIALQSEAKEQPPTKEDTRSVALGTYFILGELAIKTDMEPIQEYGEPALGVQESGGQS